MSTQLQRSIKGQKDRNPGKGGDSLPVNSKKGLHRERKMVSVDYTESTEIPAWIYCDKSFTGMRLTFFKKEGRLPAIF